MLAPLHLNLFLSSLHTIFVTLAFFDSAIHTSWYLSFVAWRMRGLLGSYFLPFIPSWARYHSSKSLLLLAKLMLSSLWPWSFWPLILPYRFTVSATTLFFFLLLITPWAYGLMFLPYQPISLLILYLGLPWPIYHIFTSFGLVGQHSCHVNLFYHFIPWAFLAHLLLLYLFLLPWACC